MDGIDVPLVVADDDYEREHHARVDAQVDLPSGTAKGIHMSRIYNTIDALGDGNALTPERLRRLIGDMIESHADCDTQRARVRLRFDLLVRRPALETPDLGGWQRYPVMLEIVGSPAEHSLRLDVGVTYSSTCPCSASLSRQLIEQGFRRDFAGRDELSTEEASAWLLENGTLATPHGQRSEARVGVAIEPAAGSFGILPLINRIEDALQTPVQTAVKRIDEQAFAARNGQNLMFVEDAARRIQAALSSYRDVSVSVEHRESLHPHDAVASTRSAWK